AEYADACNLFARAGTDVLEHKLEVLEEHCEEVGREFSAIEKTSLGTAHLARGEMSPAEVVDWCGELSDIGIEHAIFNMPNVHELAPIDTFGEKILPEVAEI
ncbi:MAG: LLM class F420-dependent oxidoreductase, partial [Anaerolineales bacterium]